jgi:hypothetical protein
MASTRLLAACVALVLALPACGGGSSSVPFDDFNTELAKVSCERIFSCCDAAEKMEQLGLFNPPPTTVEECTTSIKTFLDVFFTREPIDGGRVAYDADKAGECFDALGDAGCSVDAVLEKQSACEGILVGKVADGGQCRADAECASAGSWCDGGSTEAFGTCKARVAIGQQCTTTSECVAGSFCDSSGGTGAVCAATKGSGADCTSDDECTSDFCGEDNKCGVEPVTCDGV